MVGVQPVFFRHHLLSFISTSNGVLPAASPVRLPTRKMWVSTAMVGSPKATLSTTWLSCVRRPATLRAPRGARHLTAMLIDKMARQRDHVLGFGAEQSDGLDEVAHARFAEFRHLLRRIGELRTKQASPC